VCKDPYRGFETSIKNSETLNSFVSFAIAKRSNREIELANYSEDDNFLIGYTVWLINIFFDLTKHIIYKGVNSNKL